MLKKLELVGRLNNLKYKALTDTNSLLTALYSRKHLRSNSDLRSKTKNIIKIVDKLLSPENRRELCYTSLVWNEIEEYSLR